MRQRPLTKLVLATSLTLWFPLCVVGADRAGYGDEDPPKVFEEFSLLGASIKAADSEPAPATPAGSCAAAGQTCASGACCENQCFFISGVDATFLHARARGLVTSTSIPDPNTNTVFSRDSGSGIDTWTFSPRVYAGVQCCGWGLLGRFWYLSDSRTNNSAVLLPCDCVSTVYQDNSLKAYTADVELFRTCCIGGSKMNFYFGGRYGLFDMGSTLNVWQPMPEDNSITYTSAYSNFMFHGLGITTGFLGRTPLPGDMCMSLIWGLRGSVLWGDATSTAQSNAALITAANPIAGSLSQTNETDTSMYILEAMLGLQWDHELKCLPMSAFLRIAAEYQFWDAGGLGASAKTCNCANQPSLQTFPGAVSASVGDVDLNLIGFNVGTGFNW